MAIDVHEVPVEAHNSIGKFERYHGPLRRAYEVITADLQGTGTTAEHTLQMAYLTAKEKSDYELFLGLRKRGCRLIK